MYKDDFTARVWKTDAGAFPTIKPVLIEHNHGGHSQYLEIEGGTVELVAPLGDEKLQVAIRDVGNGPEVFIWAGTIREQSPIRVRFPEDGVLEVSSIGKRGDRRIARKDFNPKKED